MLQLQLTVFAHISHVYAFNFKLLGIMDEPETCRNFSPTIPLLYLQILCLCVIPSMCYGSLNERNGRNQMFELYLLSQIQLHLRDILWLH